ncbi:MAG: glycoside hydrolase family 3 protein [Oscillospiraceae bacterium]|nr:glycoside hydrolase family 3 protein [Oscillospiraceae bacterium]
MNNNAQASSAPSLAQDLNSSKAPAAGKTVSPETSALFRRAAAESCVLLKNDGVLPLTDSRVSVFGVCQIKWMDMGYGSGGDVVRPYTVSLADALGSRSDIRYDKKLMAKYREWCGPWEPGPMPWGQWPQHHPEMPLDGDTVASAAAESDAAIVVIGRACGESIEIALEKGSYYLTDEETAMLDAVTAAFSKVIVLLNIGNIIDLSWTARYPLSAVLAVWNGGMESGNAVADVLCGAVTPCGKLADSVALAYEDYPSSGSYGGAEFSEYREDIFVGYRYFSTFGPDRVLYPFGFGLSYTSFRMELISFRGLSAVVRVTNTGSASGREVVQLYCRAPQGLLGKAALSLCAFAKTRLLLPGQSQELELSTDEYTLASYDDAGKTAFAHSFVLEKGEYELLFGCSSAELSTAGIYSVEETKQIVRLEEACAPEKPFRRLTASGGEEDVPLRRGSLRERILSRLPAELPYTGDRGFKLGDVKAGRVSLEDFVSQLTDTELEALTRGEGSMDSDLGPAGNAGAFGGVIPSLREKGVKPVVTTDGPSGIRLSAQCLLAPCEAALACSWDTELVEAVMAEIGGELILRGSNVLLGPGVNIHRNPLCGRNFEYYSEDPLLTGRLAAAAVRGIQSKGASACPKHFCCNNQEFMRNMSDSRVSERALREIYLRGFEICIREGAPMNIMTSYNPLNGVWNHYNYDLVTTVLRGQLGYTGCVMTDWWMVPAESPDFPGVEVNAYRVRAQVDVFMPGNQTFGEKEYASDGTLLASLGKPGGITRGEIQRSAMNVLRFVLSQL